MSQQVWCANTRREPNANAVKGLEPDDRNRFGRLDCGLTRKTLGGWHRPKDRWHSEEKGLGDEEPRTGLGIARHHNDSLGGQERLCSAD
jgi:hypothetical protein